MPTVCRFVNSQAEVITSLGHMGAWMQRLGKKQLSTLLPPGSSGLLEQTSPGHGPLCPGLWSHGPFCLACCRLNPEAVGKFSQLPASDPTG